MKYTTGRGSKCKHATSMEWDEVEKKQRKSKLKYSTGRNSRLRRICGSLPAGKADEQKK